MDELTQKIQRIVTDQLRATQLQIYQNMIIPGQIKPRHLVAGENPSGTLYTSNGTDFTQLAPGTSGQVITIGSDGLPSYATPVVPTYPWTTWTPGFTGYATPPTVLFARYMIIDRLITVTYAQNALGTSNATTLTITGLPRTIATATTGAPLYTFTGYDNSANLTTPVQGEIAGTTLTLFNLFNPSGWTNTGTKGIYGFVLSYEF